MCTGTTVCIFDTGAAYDGTYLSGGTYNGYSYYSGDSIPYFIYFSTGATENIWCLSSSLGGACEQFGTLNSFSVCPDFWDGISLVADSPSACPTTTTTTTSPCDVFDFEAIFDCIITPTPSATPPPSPSATPPPTPTPSDVCGGYNISYSSITYTPTPTPTPTLTPSSTPKIERPCKFGGLANFNIFDEYMRCGNSKNFRDCFTGIDYYSSENLQYSGGPITQGSVYKINVNGVDTCASFLGLVDNISGVDEIQIIYELGLEVEGACLECITQNPKSTPTPTPTPTPSTTPSVILNNYFATRTCNPGSAVIEAPSSFVDAFAFTANDGNCYQIISETNESPTLIATNTGCTSCTEYLLGFGHPGYTIITYSPCCPSGNTITQYISGINNGLTIQDVENNTGIVVDEVIEGVGSFTFTSNSGYVIEDGLIFGGVIEELGTTCPCEEELTFKCLNIRVNVESDISWVDYTGTLQTNTYTPGIYSILCGLEDSVTSSNGPSSFLLSVGGDCTDDNPCYT